MRMLLTLFVLQLAACLSKATTQHVVENSSSIPAKHSSRRNHGRTIQQMIGGHVLFTRETLRNLRNVNVKQNNNSTAAFNKQIKNFTENNHLDDGLLLITASAGNGKNEKETTNYAKKEESKKTLSDQVAEGKYGLIHKELFQSTPKRPGILSYKSNSDVPKDDAMNYGGLTDEEIWLAEDYLLVLKGGFVNKNSNKPKWKPIDDYNAPTRQVKLPLNPKVPPPFPVQLTDNGPIQFIGNNKIPSYNPFTNQTVFLFSNERVPHIKADDLNQKSTPPWNAKDSTSPQFNGYQYPPPAPLPLGKQNHTFSNPFLNLPPLPIVGSIDEQNNTYNDEDDPSLYYPPPYSFEYKNNYNNPVSPGPLVPGIILPPPPNFFASLENEKMSVKEPMKTLDKIKDYKQKEQNATLPTPIKVDLNSTVKYKPITIKTPSYKIEIEKVNVKKFPENNEIVRTHRPVNQVRLKSTTSQPTKKSSRTKQTSRTRTQLHKINTQISHPLISLSPDNFKGNPIYFEYFDARTPMLEPFRDYSITTPIPYVTTLINEEYNYKTTTENPFNQFLLNQKRHPSKTILPVNDKSLYEAPDLGNYRYKTIQEFNKEIETIKQTLRLYENSLPIISSVRSPKAQKPIYNFSFDYRQSISPSVLSYPSSIDPFRHQTVSKTLEKPFNEKFYNEYVLNSQPLQPRPLQHFNKPDHNNYSYKDHSTNVEITSANPLGYTSFTTARPFYLTQPNWYSIDKVRVHEIPKPSIYNNGASGYNTKLYLPSKSTSQTNVSSKTIQSSQQYKGNPVSQSFSVRHTSKYSSRNQQQINEGHLEKDTLINYKHPLPVINPDSELLQFNGRKAKPIIQYQLPGDKAHVYFITPQELKYA